MGRSSNIIIDGDGVKLQLVGWSPVTEFATAEVLSLALAVTMAHENGNLTPDFAEGIHAQTDALRGLDTRMEAFVGHPVTGRLLPAHISALFNEVQA